MLHVQRSSLYVCTWKMFRAECPTCRAGTDVYLEKHSRENLPPTFRLHASRDSKPCHTLTSDSPYHQTKPDARQMWLDPTKDNINNNDKIKTTIITKDKINH